MAYPTNFVEMLTPDPEEAQRQRQAELLKVLAEPRPSTDAPLPPEETKAQRLATILAALGQAAANLGAARRGAEISPGPSPMLMELLRRRREREAVQAENVQRKGEAAYEAKQRAAQIEYGAIDKNIERATKQSERAADLARREKELTESQKFETQLEEMKQSQQNYRAELEAGVRSEIAKDRTEAQKQAKEQAKSIHLNTYSAASDELEQIVTGTPGEKNSLPELLVSGALTPEGVRKLMMRRVKKYSLILTPELADAYRQDVQEMILPILKDYENRNEFVGPLQPISRGLFTPVEPIGTLPSLPKPRDMNRRAF